MLIYDRPSRLPTDGFTADEMDVIHDIAEGGKVLLILADSDFWEYALIKWLSKYFGGGMVRASNPYGEDMCVVAGQMGKYIWDFCQSNGNPIEMPDFKSFYCELMTDRYWSTAKYIFRRHYGDLGLDGDEKMYIASAILSYLNENCEVAADGEVLYDEERTLKAINPYFDAWRSSWPPIKK